MLDLRLIWPEMVVVIVIAGLVVAVVIVEVAVELSNIFQPYGSLSARAKFDAVFLAIWHSFFHEIDTPKKRLILEMYILPKVSTVVKCILANSETIQQTMVFILIWMRDFGRTKAFGLN